MKLVLALSIVACLVAGFAPAAAAFPYGPYGYGPYGPPPPWAFGPRFGPRRFGWGPGWGWRRRLSYGTGYSGRGTWTGGPVGGLPNRN